MRNWFFVFFFRALSFPISSYLFLVDISVIWYGTVYSRTPPSTEMSQNQPVLPCMDNAWWHASNGRTGAPSMRCNRCWGKPICETKLQWSFVSLTVKVHVWSSIVYKTISKNSMKTTEMEWNRPKGIHPETRVVCVIWICASCHSYIFASIYRFYMILRYISS